MSIDFLLPIFISLIQNAWILLALLFMILLLLLSPSRWYITIFPRLVKNDSNKQLRHQLLLLALLLTVTIIYWAIDVHITELPDPAIPYVFIILIYTVLFGVKTAFIVSLLSIGLITYYLFEPRYDLNPLDNFLDISITVVGLVLSMIVGQRIRKYQQLMQKREKELELLIKTREQFSSMIAHDLKTPITTIKLYTQMMDKMNMTKKLDRTVYQAVKTIDKETSKLLSMVNTLLDYTKIQTGKLSLNLSWFDLYVLCEERTTVLQGLYPHHTFTFEAQRDNFQLYGDQLALDRVITNLLSNAAKYSPQKSTILLKLQKQKRLYIIEVKDQGQGISKIHKQHLFDPFYQIPGSRDGLGLGLYIVKAIIELHKGSIRVLSQQKKGSTFFIELPID